MVTTATSLRDLAEEYILERTAGNASRQTLRVYKYWLTHPIIPQGNGERPHPGGIAAHVQGVESLNSLTVTKWFTLLREWKTASDKNLNPSTLHQAYRTLKAFCKWTGAEGKVSQFPHNPMAGFKMKVAKSLPVVPTDQELQSVLDACGQDVIGLRNRAMMMLMCQAGLRRMEVCNLTVSDYTRGDSANLPSVFVRHGKGDRDRHVSVGVSTNNTLKQYLARRGRYDSTDRLLVTEYGQPLTGRGVAQILHRLSEKVGLPHGRRLHPHGLRHWAATSWIRAGHMGIEEVRRMLGHSSVVTTQGYLDLVPSDVAKAHIASGAFERFITLNGKK